MKRNLLHIILVMLVISTGMTSCGVKARIRKADKKYEIGEYFEAANMYKDCYRKLPMKDKVTRSEVAFKQAESYRHINSSKATMAYNNAIKNHYQDSIVYLRSAQVLQYQGKYKEAMKLYEKWLESHSDDYVGQAGKYACQQQAEWRKEYSRYKVVLAKEFNLKRTSNFAPCFIGDNEDAIMFTSNRTSGNKKQVKTSSITGEPIFALYSTRKNALGAWEEITKAEGLGGDSEGEGSGAETAGDDSGEGGEGGDTSVSAGKDAGVPEMGVCCFSQDGKTMYFTYSKPINGCDQGAQIYMSNRASGTWGEPQLVKLFEDSTITCGHPSLSYAGDTLYFVSDAPNGYGGLDIWFAEYENGNWIMPTNLGPIINTADDEMYPTIRKDGTLYFSSKGHPGYGGLDIFKATPQDSTWLLFNMGMPFNSNGDDFGITFAGETENGYFSSNRKTKDQKKEYDQIYSFTLPEMVVEVAGTVSDNNGEAIGDALVRLVGTDGTNAKMQVRKDGTYKLKLNKDVKYAMLASARGYLNQKQQLETAGVQDSKTYTQNFILSPVSKPVTMDNIFYEFGKWNLTPESEEGLNQLIKLLNDNPNITIELSAHTDKVGNADFNKKLSEKRAQSVVDYLIKHGIEAERLTPVGYGKENPVVVDKNIHDKYDFLPIEQVLDETFIDSLTSEQQEIANQINRRTEFKVLKTTYKLY